MKKETTLMRNITRRVRRNALKRRLYRRYGHRIRVDFRSKRVFRLPANPRIGKTMPEELERRFARTDGSTGTADDKRPGKANRIRPRGIR